MMKKMVKRTITLLASLAISLSCIRFDTRNNAYAAADNETTTVTVFGDANLNGKVDVADVVLIMNSLANPNKFGFGCKLGITAQGIINGDVYENGNGITNSDASSIVRFMTKKIDSLPESYLNGLNSGTTTTTSTTTTTTSTTTTAKPTTTTTTSTTTTMKPTTTTTTSTTTTAKPTTTTTTSTTTTMKPTTTTTTSTTTTMKPTTTTTTSTTTTAKPTTTTTTSTTTTMKPTTTTTTSTTTTAKPTTTTTTSTTTTAKPTTTTTTSTTTTMKPTTTTTTTTSSTTTTTTTSSTTTTTSGTWTAPRKEDLVFNGWQISDETYDILVNTAKFFGIDQYEIIWSDHPVEYGYVNPGLYFCMRNGIAYGYGLQVIPGTDVQSVAGNMNKVKLAQYKKNDYIAYRPLVADDNLDYVLQNFDSAEGAYKAETNVVVKITNINEPTKSKDDYSYNSYLFTLESMNSYNSFEFINWYLIPVDANGNKFELGYGNNTFNTNVSSPVETKYWFTNEELSCGGIPISKGLFDSFINTAKQFKMDAFRIAYNDSETVPVFYSFLLEGTAARPTELVAVQIIKGEDITKIMDLKAWLLDMENGDVEMAEIRYEEFVNAKWWFFTLAENDRKTEPNLKYQFYSEDGMDNFKKYIMIPLNEDGSDDLRIYF